VCGAYVTVKSRRGAQTFECSADKGHDVSSIGAAGEREPEEVPA
jgi:hypothetical protein